MFWRWGLRGVWCGWLVVARFWRRIYFWCAFGVGLCGLCNFWRGLDSGAKSFLCADLARLESTLSESKNPFVRESKLDSALRAQKSITQNPLLAQISSRFCADSTRYLFVLSFIICTSFIAFSRGRSGIIPCPRLNICPSRLPITRSISSTPSSIAA